MQGIYTYIPETNKVPKEYIVADILLLLFMVPISLVPSLALLCFYVIIIIIIIIIICFMQGIYTYIPETNSVPREYIVTDILLLLFMVPISLVPSLALLCFYVIIIIIIIIIITIIIIIIISFKQVIYTYIPETKNVPREYIVAAVLLLLFMVPICLVPSLALLCFYVIIIIIIILMLQFF
jgi:hypothetical protein